MSLYIPVFLIVLAFLAIFFKANFVLILTYLLIGVYFIGKWWGSRALKEVVGQRELPSHVFFGEKILVKLVIRNKSILPVVWLQLQESFPVELRTNIRSLVEVISLRPKAVETYSYQLVGRKRGVYPIGPLFLSSGDIFGLGEPETRQITADFLTVYPKIIPLVQVNLPSRSPMGTLRYHQPIYEDPTRVRGKRDYISGDSMKNIDWKASASSGRLQVKIFEPSIALETAIFLNLNAEDYERHSRIDASELAIIVAASLANWIIRKKQSVGLFTNGIEPVLEVTVKSQSLVSDLPFQNPLPIPPRRGQSHLMSILEVLARVQVAETYPLTKIIFEQTSNLAWGTTLLVVTPKLDDLVFDSLFHANRAGLKTVLIPCGPVVGVDEIRKRAEYFGFPLFQVFNERDLDMWRN
jgi:uncharacterized protein (DUF58 family)